jgi:REP element-mobilizing transposase RayT
MTFKPRVGRLKWVFTDHPVYFLAACTQRRRPILDNRVGHDSFRAFALGAEKFRVLVGAYTIMPDHLHCFVGFMEGAPSLWMWMKSLRNTLSKALKETGVMPPHWQDGFLDHLLRSEESYQDKWHYVRENPVRAGLVKQAEDWPFQGQIHRLEVSKRRS